jgi:hypothetical protein
LILIAMVMPFQMNVGESYEYTGGCLSGPTSFHFLFLSYRTLKIVI